jgi:hypothetical protein
MQLNKGNKHMINILLLIQFVVMFFYLLPVAGSKEQELQTLLVRQYSAPPSFSVIDVNRNGTNELAVSEDGYLHIFELSNGKFDEKWKSSQYSYVIPSSDRRVNPITINSVSSVHPIRYKLGNNIKESFLFSAQTSVRKTDFYELSFHDGRYDVQKKVSLPSGLSPRNICDDKITVFFGQSLKDDTKQMAIYDWNGKDMIEKWHGQQGIGLAIPGKLIITDAIQKDVILYAGSQNIMLYCEKGQIKTKTIGKIETPFGRFNPSDSIIGITKKGSLGEIWTIERPNDEDTFYYKLYMGQFNGSGFTRFNKINIKGINTDRVSAITIVDLDGDGVGEIIGSEVAGSLVLPAEGEGPELKDERSYLFAAKWNGQEYEVMWRRRAADCILQRISVDDVAGDGHKEIIAEGYSLTKNVYSLFVFNAEDLSK